MNGTAEVKSFRRFGRERRILVGFLDRFQLPKSGSLVYPLRLV